MASQAILYSAITALVKGRTVNVGSQMTPSVFGIDDYEPRNIPDMIVPKQTAVGPFPDPTKLWDYTHAPYFSFLMFRIVTPSMDIWAAEHCDLPTSATDPTPTGTAIGVNRLTLCSHVWYIMGSEKRPVNPSVVIANGIDANGIPTILTDVGTVTGRSVAFWVKALQTTTDVTVQQVLLRRKA